MSPSTFRSLILVNASARNGQALRFWKKIRDDVMKKIPGLVVESIFSSGDNVENKVKKTIHDHKINCFISAGGDGSLNYLINLLINSGMVPSSKIFVGGIGIGSSNDFIKPIVHKIDQVPTRLEYNKVRKHDIGVLHFRDKKGIINTRYFLLNASIGVTAEANLLFNDGDLFLPHLKKHFINSAIIYAAIKTIITYKNFSAKLYYNGRQRLLDISNLSVIKNHYISGGLHFDQHIISDCGYFGLNYCFDMSSLELIKTLIDLNFGRFSGKAKRETCKTKKIKIIAEKDLAIETDGEVQKGNEIQFSILPKAINILGL